MDECPSCGEVFERLGLHWWHGTCPYPELSSNQKQILIGLLMGDGSIPSQSGGNNSIYHLPMTNRRFLRWFDDTMGVLTTGVSLKKTAVELAVKNRQTGFSPTARPENYHDIYTVWSRTNPYFDQLQKQWYENGKKVFPVSLSLSPTKVKFWYVSDGYLDVGRWGRPRIEIKTRNEKDRVEYLVDLFEEVGFSPVFRRNELRFTCDDTERLVEWMGDYPPGFEYKWELDSRERYRELKQRAYEEYTTQTVDTEE